jgi:hypothetical protein
MGTECTYVDCHEKGRYQRLTIETKGGEVTRRETELFCPGHWWDIEEKKPFELLTRTHQ